MILYGNLGHTWNGGPRSALRCWHRIFLQVLRGSTANQTSQTTRASSWDCIPLSNNSDCLTIRSIGDRKTVMVNTQLTSLKLLQIFFKLLCFTLLQLTFYIRWYYVYSTKLLFRRSHDGLAQQLLSLSGMLCTVSIQMHFLPTQRRMWKKRKWPILLLLTKGGQLTQLHKV